MQEMTAIVFGQCNFRCKLEPLCSLDFTVQIPTINYTFSGWLIVQNKYLSNLFYSYINLLSKMNKSYEKKTAQF